RLVRLGKPGEAPSIWATWENAGGAFVLRPEKWIEAPQQVNERWSAGFLIRDIGDRPGKVADFKPRSLWGDQDGELFTVLDARMSLETGWGPPQQVYEARAILWGAHIMSEESPADAVRIAFSLKTAGWRGDHPV